MNRSDYRFIAALAAYAAAWCGVVVAALHVVPC